MNKNITLTKESIAAALLALKDTDRVIFFDYMRESFCTRCGNEHIREANCSCSGSGNYTVKDKPNNGLNLLV